MGWKEKLARFMQGRYGVDSFSKFLLVAAVIVVLLSGLLRSDLLSILGWVILIYSYVRTFSRNYEKRYRENQKYLELTGRLKNMFKGGGAASAYTADREHKIFKCPACGQKTRVPKGKGKIEIECPRCHNKFVKRT